MASPAKPPPQKDKTLISIGIYVLVIAQLLYTLNHSPLLPSRIQSILDSVSSTLAQFSFTLPALPRVIRNTFEVLAAGAAFKLITATEPRHQFHKIKTSFFILVSGVLASTILYTVKDCSMIWQEGEKESVCMKDCIGQVVKCTAMELMAVAAWNGSNWDGGLVNRVAENIGFREKEVKRTVKRNLGVGKVTVVRGERYRGGGGEAKSWWGEEKLGNE